MKFYIASSLDNAEAVKELRDSLVTLGWEITYDWTVHGSVQDSPSRWAEVAKAESRGVYGADVLIMLQPGRRGTHVELGIAIGLGLTAVGFMLPDGSCCNGPEIHIIGDDGEERTCVFYHLPGVKRHVDAAAFLESRFLR